MVLCVYASFVVLVMNRKKGLLASAYTYGIECTPHCTRICTIARIYLNICIRMCVAVRRCGAMRTIRIHCFVYITGDLKTWEY